GAQVARTQPAGFVGGDAGAWRNAFDAPEERAEYRSPDAVAGGGRCRMRPVAVDIPGGEDLAVVYRAARFRAVREPARADELVVAAVGGELLSFLADAVPFHRRIEHERVLELVVAPAKPFAEDRVLCPETAAGTRAIGFPRVGERGMLRRNAAVDDRDHDALAIETGSSPEPDVPLEQAEELRAVTRAERAHFVLPDTQDFRLVLELVCLGGSHAGSETVHAVTVAVDFFRPNPS